MLTEPQRGDHALVVALLYGMRHGWDIRVEGDVSPRLLEGLEALQAIWWRWAPDLYTQVSITAAREIEAPAAAPKSGLFAFSGGVDGTYTFFKHFHGAAGRATCRPAAALLVHGMDIPLNQSLVFDSALARGSRMLEETNIPLLPIRTNSRDLGMNWEHSYGLQLAGCFLVFQGSFDMAFKASGEPYEDLVMPWGSTPLTDQLASTERMKMVHDGCEASRSEKVDWLVKHTTVCDYLRVCWEGPTLDRNCGGCEKCIRTMLNFWQNGHTVSAAFPTRLTPDLVSRGLQPRNSTQLKELQSILRLAKDRKTPSDPILRALEQVVKNGVTESRRGIVHRFYQALQRRVK
ncbi:hypothetical protein INT08_06165 [Prosthecochloris sp. N3]|uniref:ATPase n=1 Tax=Prosthecochloris ethylica TaxID=2743976 RepID=A0ABR9XS02_9CHLB|nr:hypothetical protein [Prosthecochloris ethylica]MBF0586893.1 hypothetical protein [Prosthecochloris ethylica]MBF0636759.1 hypothetical protein [Prosthecochloris ethylica]NUK48436.1 hypothetical protein [Prosthecochloris ethylica]